MEEKTPKEELMSFIKEECIGNQQVTFIITKQGFQRIEIKDLDNEEIWQELEVTETTEDPDNWDDICEAMLGVLFQQLGAAIDEYAQLN